MRGRRSATRARLTRDTAAVTCLALTPDVSLRASGSEDKTVRAWDTATGELLWRLRAKRVGVYGVRFERG